jgi:hypothetical protein
MGCKEGGDPEGGVVVMTPEDIGESTVDLIFTLTERQDRIRKYFQKKIKRLDRQVPAHEDRGRP